MLLKVEELRKYVHEFTIMAAKMVTVQGHNGYPVDHDEKVKLAAETAESKDTDGEDLDGVKKKWNRKPKTAKGKVAAKHGMEEVCRSEIKTLRDPYEGHGIQIDELQRNWENAIRRVHQELNENRGTAKERMDRIRKAKGLKTEDIKQLLKDTGRSLRNIRTKTSLLN